ncbi:DUF1559 domain-containing protein [Aeoliella sp. ICT_H6.2]|uniref:DUF1559 domain-containing protein n=1 Tax=Aeoliella straminimaris TaxID=2954799 RepID=A0A9X2FBX0_9BACT|nr:DUF1559 domain-containing protein [Aeoliella straminimaris]
MQAAREAARRTQCQNNLKQLGLGMQLYHDANNVFPPGHTDWNADTRYNRQHSWMTLILPNVEQQALYDLYDFERKWNQGDNGRLVTRSENGNLSVQLCPSSEHISPAQGDYAGINGCATYSHDGITIVDGWDKGQGYEAGLMPATGTRWPRNKPKGIKDCTDGTTYTILLGEDAGRTDKDRYWGTAEQTFAHHNPVLNAVDINGEPQRSNEMYSDHPGGLYSVFAGGNVRWLSEYTSERVIDFMTTRAQQELLDGDSFEQ